jgi:integrase
VAQAKADALQIIGSLARGIDPRDKETQARIKGLTLRQVLDAYLARPHAIKPSTCLSYRQTFDRVFAEWAEKPWTSISSNRVWNLHREVTSKHGPGYANLSFRILRAILEFAMNAYRLPDDTALIHENPVNILTRTKSWNKLQPRSAHIPYERLAVWWSAVNGLDNQSARDALFLMILTGLRLNEALGLKWQHVDLQAATLVIPETKNGKSHTLPLSGRLVGLLAARMAVSSSHYVFAGKGEGGRLVEIKRPVQRVCRETGLVFTPHALRRSFAMYAEHVGESDTTIKRLLNHSVAGDVTVNHYRPIQIEGMRRSMERITMFVLRCAGQVKDEVVVAISAVA